MRDILILGLLSLSTLAFAQTSEFKMPRAGTAEAIPVGSGGPERIFGGYSNGCILGAKAFATSTPGWELMNTKRNHQHGHSSLHKLVESLAEKSVANGWGKLTIGDSSAPCGGRLGRGHASHRIGLDVDIFFKFRDLNSTLSHEERNAWTEDVQEANAIASFKPWLKKNGKIVAEMTSHYRPEHLALVREAALAEGVARIFVSPPIKRELCRVYGPGSEKVKELGWPAWLKKVRPWNGHRSHFHVRLSCPDSSPNCQNQPDIKVDPSDRDGLGCDGGEFKAWFRYKPGSQPRDRDEEKEPTMSAGWPKECRARIGRLNIIDVSANSRCILDSNETGPRRLRCRNYEAAENFERFTKCSAAETKANPTGCLFEKESDLSQN